MIPARKKRGSGPSKARRSLPLLVHTSKSLCKRQGKAADEGEVDLRRRVQRGEEAPHDGGCREQVHPADVLDCRARARVDPEEDVEWQSQAQPQPERRVRQAVRQNLEARIEVGPPMSGLASSADAGHDAQRGNYVDHVLKDVGRECICLRKRHVVPVGKSNAGPRCSA
eukprot:1953869-Pleurochrysis_carterae.AAC.2